GRISQGTFPLQRDQSSWIELDCPVPSILNLNSPRIRSAWASVPPPRTFLLSLSQSRNSSDSNSRPYARQWMFLLSTPHSGQLKIDRVQCPSRKNIAAGATH